MQTPAERAPTWSDTQHGPDHAGLGGTVGRYRSSIRPSVGVRSRERTAVGVTEVKCLLEMALPTGARRGASALVSPAYRPWVRSRDGTAIGATEVGCLFEMARCQRGISAGQAPR